MSVLREGAGVGVAEAPLASPPLLGEWGAASGKTSNETWLQALARRAGGCSAPGHAPEGLVLPGPPRAGGSVPPCAVGRHQALQGGAGSAPRQARCQVSVPNAVRSVRLLQLPRPRAAFPAFLPRQEQSALQPHRFCLLPRQPGEAALPKRGLPLQGLPGSCRPWRGDVLLLPAPRPLPVPGGAEGRCGRRLQRRPGSIAELRTLEARPARGERRLPQLPGGVSPWGGRPGRSSASSPRLCRPLEVGHPSPGGAGTVQCRMRRGSLLLQGRLLP